MKSKRLFVILISIALATIIIIAGIFVFTVKQVKGEFSLYNQDSAQIQGYLDEFSGENLLFFDTEEIKEKIEQNPYLEVVEVEKNFPNVIEVKVRERKEVYLIKYENETYILDDEGYVLSKLEENRQLNLRDYIYINDFNVDGNEMSITAINVGSKIQTSDDEVLYKSLEMSKLAGLTDCIKSISVYNKAISVCDVSFETYTGVAIKVLGIKSRGEEKTKLAFDAYKGEQEDYVKTYDTIEVDEIEELDENGNKKIKVVWTSVG